MEAINKQQLAVVKGQVTKAENIANTLIIKSEADYELAGKKYIEVKKLQKEFKAEYDSWMKPINELRNKVFAVSRPMEVRFKAALDTLNKSMTAWESKMEAERQAEAAKLEAKADAGEMTLEDATDKAGKLTTVDPVQSDKGKLGSQVRHELVVTDEAKLDRQFLVPDLGKIREHYQGTGLLPAGVELRKVVVRTARIA